MDRKKYFMPLFVAKYFAQKRGKGPRIAIIYRLLVTPLPKNYLIIPPKENLSPFFNCKMQH